MRNVFWLPKGFHSERAGLGSFDMWSCSPEGQMLMAAKSEAGAFYVPCVSRSMLVS